MLLVDVIMLLLLVEGSAAGAAAVVPAAAAPTGGGNRGGVLPVPAVDGPNRSLWSSIPEPKLGPPPEVVSGSPFPPPPPLVDGCRRPV